MFLFNDRAAALVIREAGVLCCCFCFSKLCAGLGLDEILSSRQHGKLGFVAQSVFTNRRRVFFKFRKDIKCISSASVDD